MSPSMNVCPKCREMDIARTVVQVEPPQEARNALIQTDQIKCVCRICGYSWRVDPPMGHSAKEYVTA